jgi:sugar lactone lactonase YvrE
VEAIALGSGYTNSAAGSAAYTIVAAMPTFSPVAGSYIGAQTVTIGDATGGATTYYTTNGSTPTTNSTVYSGPITVSVSETLTAIAAGGGNASSAVASAAYTIAANTPTFSPAAGNYGLAQTVTISDSTTGSTIYYTTDGTTPTTGSSIYSSPFTVSTAETLEAIATAAGDNNSAVGSTAYTITIGGPAATPNFSLATGTYLGTQTVTISDTSIGATIYYTVTAGTAGTVPTTNSAIYTGPVTIPSTSVLEAIAMGGGFTPSAVDSAAYNITLAVSFVQQCTDGGSTTCTLNGVGAGDTLVIGVYSGPLTSLTSSSGTPVGVISNFVAVLGSGSRDLNVYLLPNTAPGSITITANVSSGSTAGVNSIVVDEYTHVAASPLDGSATGYMQVGAAVDSGTFVTTQANDMLWSMCNALQVFPTPGTAPITWTAVLAQGGPGGAGYDDYFVEDGLAGAAGTYYGECSNPYLSNIATIALMPGSSTGPAATPTFSPAAGTYSSAQTVTISDITTGAVVYYTTDGTTPTTGSAVYSAALTVSASETLEALAVASGYANSAVGSAAYTIGIPVAATPTFSPAAGTFTSTQTVTISDGTSGATIYYTTNGTTPTTSSSTYSSAITVSATETLEAIATASSYSQSAMNSAVYTISSSSSSGSPAYVQQCLGAWTGSSVACTLSGVTAGDTLVIGIYDRGQSETVTSSSGTPTLVANDTDNMIAYILPNASAGSITITVTPGSSATMSVIEYSNVAASSLDGFAAQGWGSQASPIDSPNFTTTTASDLLWTFCAVPSDYPAPTVGTAPITWTVRATSSALGLTGIVEDGPTTAVGSYYGQCADSAGGWDIIALALKPAPNLPAAATPTFSPTAGTYTSIQTVTISTSTPSSAIYYTTDGSTPTYPISGTTQLYSAAITVSATETVNAIAVAAGYAQSAVGSAVYTLNLVPVTFEGALPYVNFGSQAIGTASSPQQLNFSIASGTTVGSIGIFTTGVTGKDFADSGSSTCTAKTYSSTANCVVSVKVKPLASGLRLGAVVFYSGAGNTGTVLAMVPIYATGTGPQIAYSPVTPIAIAPTVNSLALTSPQGIGVDQAGNLYITDAGNTRLLEVPIGGGTATAIDPSVSGQGLSAPADVAVDGAGDIFIADYNNNWVVEVPTGGGAPIAIDPTVNGSSLQGPDGVAVDGAGNLYIADSANNRVVEVPSGGGTPIAIAPTVNSTPMGGTSGVTVDAAGDLFIVDQNNNWVVEVPAGNGAAFAINPTVNGLYLNYPQAAKVDGAGDLFIADTANGRVVEVPAGGGAAIAIDPTVSGLSLNWPQGIAVDGSGNLFISDSNNNWVVELQRSQPPAISFPTETTVGTTDTTDGTDGTQTVRVKNIGNLPLTLTALSYPADFSAASGDANACGSSTSLNAGQLCDLPIQFTPENSGLLNEDVTLTDNALNVTGAQQSIPVNGTGNALVATPTFSPAAGSYLGTQTVTISDATAGATIYYTTNATAPTTSSPAYIGPITVTATETLEALAAISGSPASAVASAIYTIETQAALTTPTPDTSTALSGTSVAFTWTPGNTATHFELWVGTTGVGSSNLYNSGSVTATTETVSVLPGNGEKLYVRLYSLINGAWQYTDYTYVAYGSLTPAALTTPAPNTSTALSGTSVAFTWTPGNLATHYQFYVGSTGVGSSNIYNSGNVTATTETVSVLPSNGEKLYVRLSSLVNGAWQSTDYTYVAHGSPTQAALTTPAPNTSTALSGTSVAFTWTPGNTATNFELWVGTTGVGSSNLYNSGSVTATTETVSVLPSNGEKLYVRLYSLINGAWQYTDYTYVAYGSLTPAALTTPTPDTSTALSGTSVTFTWTPGNLATHYEFYVGSTGVGSSNIYNSGNVTATTETVSVLPGNGEKLYVRLSSLVNGAWQSTDYTYVAHGSPTQAALTTPAPNTSTALSGTSVAFTWTPGNTATNFELWVGTTGVGSSNLYNSGSVTATTETVSVLPSNGEKLYVRLYSLINGAWQYTDYTYVAYGSLTPAALTTPTPDTSTALSGTSVAFTWTPGNLATHYEFYVGSTGVGSSNIYNSGNVTATTETVSVLPSNGEKLYVRLSSLVNGAWQSTDYTYVAHGSPTQAALTTPTPNTSTALSGTSVAFTWTPGNTAANFELWVGTTGVGSSNLYNSGSVTATTETVSVLPSNGEKLYVRLYSLINGAWQPIDYTYVAYGSPTQAVLTTPTPDTSTALSGTSVAFSWTPSNIATHYELWVGTTGVGSSNLYNSGSVTATTETVSVLPSNGKTVYVRLYSLINGAWLYTNYTYVAF